MMELRSSFGLYQNGKTMSHLGEWAALATAVIWSCSSMVFTAATKRIGAPPVNYVRLVMATALLSITIYALRIPMDLNATQAVWLLLSGLTGLVFGDTYLFRAFHRIGARLSMLIMSSSPALAAVLAYAALGEVLAWEAVLGMVVTMSGIALVVFQRHEDERRRPDAAGLVYAFLGSLGQAVGLVCARFAFDSGTLNSVAAVFVRIASSTAIMTLFFLFKGQLSRLFLAVSGDTRTLSLTAVGTLLGPYLGITLSLVAIQYTRIGIASTIMATVPIVMLPMVVVVYGEKLTWKAVIGALAAVGGVALLFMG